MIIITMMVIMMTMLMMVMTMMMMMMTMMKTKGKVAKLSCIIEHHTSI